MMHDYAKIAKLSKGILRFLSVVSDIHCVILFLYQSPLLSGYVSTYHVLKVRKDALYAAGWTYEAG